MKRIGRLHVITDNVLQSRFSHIELTTLAIKGGADTIQFRRKDGSTRELIETARQMQRICSDAGVTFIVNDRIDVAIAAEADGVHLGQDDFPIPLARTLIGNGRIIGGSAATMEEVRKCVSEGADYVGFGPVYPTSSKEDAGPVSGMKLLKKVVTAVDVPIIGIGGITSDNAPAVMNTGAYGVAVISSVCCQQDPEKAAQALRRALEQNDPGGADG